MSCVKAKFDTKSASLNASITYPKMIAFQQFYSLPHLTNISQEWIKNDSRKFIAFFVLVDSEGFSPCALDKIDLK